jgi:hypothetical protein
MAQRVPAGARAEGDINGTLQRWVAALWNAVIEVRDS